MRRRIDRRQFLGRVSKEAAGGAVAAFGLTALARARSARVDANSRIAIGLIGCGDLGRNHHLRHLLGREECDVVAVCDVDRDHVDEAVDVTGGRAAACTDYRALLDRHDVDAVMIVTPDHWHSLPTIHACEAGKDVYCEKPLSLTIAEGRAMADGARRYGRVVQTGSQQRSSRLFFWAVDLVRNGRIGKLERVRACIGRGPTCAYEPNTLPPSHLDWEAWLGPAPRVPYTRKRCHYTFRWFHDYSGGKLTDWGAHHLDVAQWANDASLSGPVEVEATGTFPAEGLFDTAVTFDVHYRYANGVTLHCTSEGENGVTFEGTGGTIFVSRSRIAGDPAELLDQEPGFGTNETERSDDHHGNWIDCMRSRARPICDVEIGHRSATVCHLGNIALRLGRKLAWDPERERFVGDDAANRMILKPMRLPYGL